MNQPAKAADSSTGASAEKPSADQSRAKRAGNPFKRFFKVLGPGLITGASDDDPSGIGTYAMAGASFGYATLWIALITFPLMAGVQFICAKIGLVAGCGIGRVMRRHYPRFVAYPAVVALIIANVINAAADIMAIAAGINLLVRIPILAMILPIGLAILVVQVWGSYQLIQRIFKWLTLALFAYIGSAFLARPNWHEVLKGTLIPTLRFDSDFLSMLVALLGTTISPYLFFWQANQEVEDLEAKNHNHDHPQDQNANSDRHNNYGHPRLTASKSQLQVAAWDVNAGMLLSNVVMFFIILATAATLHRTGHTHIDTATDAAEALRPIAGNAAFVLMALGLIGSG
ncbi:MAG TPA: divalent metal cation transporter, partial [Pirellulales bacterium]